MDLLNAILNVFKELWLLIKEIIALIGLSIERFKESFKKHCDIDIQNTDTILRDARLVRFINGLLIGVVLTQNYDVETNIIIIVNLIILFELIERYYCFDLIMFKE